MQTLDAEQAAAMDNTRKLPEFSPGDVVEIRMVTWVHKLAVESCNIKLC